MTVAFFAAGLLGLLALRWGAAVQPARSVHPVRAPMRTRRPRAATTGEWAVYLDRLAREVRSGRGFGGALDDVQPPNAVSVLDADRAVVEHTIAAAARLGGAVAPALDAAAAVLRERAASAAEAQAHSAQARLSARILTLVPIAFATWGTATSPRVRDAYLHSPVGLACAAVGLGLNVTGWWWMRRIVRGAA